MKLDLGLHHPAKANSTTPGTFPSEIWEKIIPQVNDTPALAALCRTSKFTRHLATGPLYEVVRLNTRQALFRWLTMPEKDRAVAMRDTKHLEISFDLRYLRDKEFKELFLRGKKKGKTTFFGWDGYHSLQAGRDKLESVHLSTSGYEWYKELPEEGDPQAVFDQGSKDVTLSNCVDRLLFMLVGDLGPVNFKWTSAPRMLSQSTSLMPGEPRPKTSMVKTLSKISSSTIDSLLLAHWKWINGVNMSRRNSKHPHPQFPSILYRWPRLETIDLPWLMRPTWYSNYYAYPKTRTLRVFSIDAGCLHKLTRSFGLIYLMKLMTTRHPSLYRDDSNEHEQGHTIIEIRGRCKRGREGCITDLYDRIVLYDHERVIRVVRVGERKETASQWRERLVFNQALREEATLLSIG
ncbi:hypothetical protein IAT40_003397 [Kwoniella sp. CBS 6097]